MCSKPFRRGVMEFGCGQCMPCRINRRRLWTARILLEQLGHSESWFVTLTYDKENHPQDGSLVPKHLCDYLKRVRSAISPRQIRYYAVGEYGEKNFRPHYHLCVFGAVGDTDIFVRCWRFGFVHVGEINKDTASYVAGYTIKKMTRHDDPRLGMRHPEFTRMSLRNPGGIGYAAAKEMARFVNTSEGAKVMVRKGDVVDTFRHERQKYPIGRYLKSVVRKEAGYENIGEQLLPFLRVQKLLESLDPEEIARREARRQADRDRAKSKKHFINIKRKL